MREASYGPQSGMPPGLRRAAEDGGGEEAAQLPLLMDTVRGIAEVGAGQAAMGFPDSCATKRLADLGDYLLRLFP